MKTCKETAVQVLFIGLSLLLVTGGHAKHVIDSQERAAVPQFVAVNDQPVIGILSQELSYSMTQNYGDEGYDSYIAASYVKFVEGAGARVVPIWINQPADYYENIMSNLNGVLLPGGATWFNQSNGYADAGRHIYDIAVQYNENGDYFPVWGTCLGFELLTYLAANGAEHRAHCSSNSQALPLNFKNDFRNSRMFADAPNDVIDILSNEPVTANFHQFCVTEANLTAYGLDQDWRVMSVDRDWNGMEFISTIEHKNYPFYGIQFHPEKNIYEWVQNKNISHTANAIRASQFFADFFIEESRKSEHQFASEAMLEKHVIYNYQPTFTGLKRSSFEQCYMFRGNYIDQPDGDQHPDSSSASTTIVPLATFCMLPLLTLRFLIAPNLHAVVCCF
ncbi:gamma-glutamyl hydrolase A-like isoform X1 [Anopheles stephensi]|uniref:gamma-glutamyl hydrolase A-like isoform X1 n=1 Tax=Anopheles stephensi TaxID=30069 RepID=UPI001658AE9A|nr:gamma-glutamyl hydrolase A-like isoform X1 [Anopheles stephensi]